MFFLFLFVITKSFLLNLYNLFHRNQIIISCLLILFIFFTTTFITSALASKTDPEIEYRWIEYSFNKGETAQTINEGLRFIYFYPTHKYSDNVRMFIGKSYMNNNDFDKAIETFKGLSKGASKQEIREEAELWLSNSLLKQGKYSTARHRCDDFLVRYPRSIFRDKAQYQKAWSFLREWKWEDAEKTFREIDPNSDLFYPAQEIIKETQGLSSQKGKSPLTAGILSIFLPGSGYAYLGKWQTGIAAFIVNVAFIGAGIESFDNDLPILGSMISIVEIGWYSGTIYGSIQGAKSYNYKFREEKLRSLNQRYTLTLLQMRF